MHSVPTGVATAQPTIVEDQVIGIVRRTRAWDLEDVTRQCTNLMWNYVFLGIDGMSRSGEFMLVSRGQGLSTVIFRQTRDGRPYPRSVPS